MSVRPVERERTAAAVEAAAERDVGGIGRPERQPGSIGSTTKYPSAVRFTLSLGGEARPSDRAAVRVGVEPPISVLNDGLGTRSGGIRVDDELVAVGGRVLRDDRAEVGGRVRPMKKLYPAPCRGGPADGGTSAPLNPGVSEVRPSAGGPLISICDPSSSVTRTDSTGGVSTETFDVCRERRDRHRAAPPRWPG